MRATVFTLFVALVLAGCSKDKLDRAEIDRLVKTSSLCAKDNDLVCVLRIEVKLEKIVLDASDLGREDKEYFDAAVKRVEADVETVKATPPGGAPTTK